MRMPTDSPENYSQSSRVVAGVSAKMLTASLLHSSVEHLLPALASSTFFFGKWDEYLDGNLDFEHPVQSSGDCKTLYIPACMQFKRGDISDLEAAIQIISCISG